MKIFPLLVPLLVLGAALAVTGCSKQQSPAAKKNSDSVATGNPITAPVDYLGAVAKAKHFSEKVIDTSSISQAIQLFYASEDRFPKDLNELVAKHYIGGLPAAPRGMRWGYNPQTGEIKAVRQP
jgi:hypothetical protein